MSAMTEEFVSALELFINECDAKEEYADWDYAERGHMAAYYQNDMLSFLLRLMGTDGVFSEQETDLLNETFSFRYRPDELEEIYETCESELGDDFDEHLEEDIRELYRMDENMGQMFMDLLLLICDMMAQSDGFVYSKEDEEIAKLHDIMSNI